MNKNLYLNYEGWFDYKHVYDEMFETMYKPNHKPIFVEIGSFCGRSACYMAALMQEKSGGTIILIDDCSFSNDENKQRENLYDAMLKMRENFPDVEIHLIEALSDDAIEPLKNMIESSKWDIDGVFVDGGHSHPQCYSDLVNYFPVIKKGGVIAGHDLCHGDLPGVGHAVMQFCRENKLTFVGIPGDGSVDPDRAFGCFLIKK